MRRNLLLPQGYTVDSWLFLVSSTSSPSQISNCCLSFGTQGSSWRLESCSLQRLGDTQRLPRPGAPQGLAQFHKELLGQSTESHSVLHPGWWATIEGYSASVELGGEQCFVLPRSHFCISRSPPLFLAEYINKLQLPGCL